MSVNINQYDTLTQATEDLKARGFIEELSVNEESCLIDSHDPSQAFKANEVTVVEFHRFEGESDPSDMTIVYALEMPNGKRGLLIDAFGVNSDERVDTFVKFLHVPHGAAGDHVPQQDHPKR